MNLQKKILLFLLILLLFILQACASFQPTPQPFQNRIDSLFYSDFFKSSQAGISVYDLTANKPLFQHNEKLLLRPASNQKILTTAAGYLFLGEDYKFKTSVYHTGEVKDSICNGDIYIVGGLDPDFSSHDLDSLVSKIKHYGIKEIRGNLYGDVSAMDSLFWGEGWMWDDDPEPYAAYLTSLNINKNSVQIVYEPGEIGKEAVIELIPKTNFFQIKNSSLTIDTGKTTIRITRDWINRNNTIPVKGNITRTSKRDTISLNVFNPTFYFLNLMKESIEQNGISFNGKVDTLTLPIQAKKIFSFERNIESVITNTNKASDNLSAEMILRTLALNSSNKPATAAKGIRLIDSLITLAGLNPKNYRLVDGSGLSNYNLISAELLSEILKYYYFKKTDLFPKLLSSFPISGVDGTLRNRMKESRVFKRVHGKTGTLSGVSNLSGYLESRNGHIIAFSILIQNFVGTSVQARSVQEKLCEIIFEMN
ncbi:MAG: D-alanyl-D-alanine carboxypeptidase/D-alanyl-D-alanine-endopeptidase [Ignavibacteriales bacterium]|nr:D-alanyl-D-alanine carboxypeptidase/D-alanyl-D-alanine-endopeptidase [Ignavibacteriales bacterium]